MQNLKLGLLFFIYMKRLLIVFLASLLVCAFNDVQAQNKNTKNKAKTTKTSSKSKKSKSKKGKKVEEEAPVSNDIPLPYNSNDCLFAIELKPDVEYGPTTAPSGGGRIMEIMSDKKHPNLFDYEHNSVWYKFTVPYNGDLEIAITQTNPLDDYDFLLYRYTDDYFSNHVLQNKILPVAANLSAVDSSLSKTPTTTKGKTAKATTPVPSGATIGMKYDAKDALLTKKSTERFIKSIPVHKDEVYYLVLDNATIKGSGHSVKVSIHVDAFEPQVLFFDPIAKKYIDVELLILEKNTGNREILKSSSFKSGKIRFVPNFNYTLYAKRDGYFSIFKDFNSNIFMTDTMMRFVMNRTEKGTSFPISDIYFDEGESSLLPESDTVLLNYIAMFRNHPSVTFLIKGYVTTYGVDVERDQRVSLERAQSVKDFFARNGISADRIEVVGMTPSEIKRVANAMLDKKQQQKNNPKVELIITGIKKTE